MVARAQVERRRVQQLASRPEEETLPVLVPPPIAHRVTDDEEHVGSPTRHLSEQAPVDVIVTVPSRLAGDTEAERTLRRWRGIENVELTRLPRHAVVILRIRAQSDDLDAVDSPGAVLCDGTFRRCHRPSPTGQAAVHGLRLEPLNRPALFFLGRLPHDRHRRPRRPLQVRPLDDDAHTRLTQKGCVHAAAAP